MTSSSTQARVVQVHRVYIRATAQAIWDAITKPEWTSQYGYTGLVEYDLRPGGAYQVRPTEAFRAGASARGNELPDVVIDGEVLEVDPPRKLVTTFRMLMDEQTAAEPATRITYEIKERANGVCSLTLTHELDGAPVLASIVGGRWEDQGAGGGHTWVLNDLKSLLETGRGFAG